MLFCHVISYVAEVLYFENMDLENIVTPVNVNVLEKLLIEAKYDPRETEYLVKGFRNSFDLGYRGPEDVRINLPNLKLQNPGDDVKLWNKVMKEVKERRYAGPFSKVPFDSYIQSPIGLVPKDNGKDVRLIFHLSYPRNPKCGSKISVNSNTPEEFCSVKYPDFDQAIKLCLKEGKAGKIAKSDMKAAFRNLGMLKRHWKFLVMKAKSPKDGKIYYFVDKCLPFGSSISCAHFQRFSNAIAYLVKHRTGRDLVNYLDDYMFTALLRFWCNNQVEIFLQVCNLINFPISLEKTV